MNRTQAIELVSMVMDPANQAKDPELDKAWQKLLAVAYTFEQKNVLEPMWAAAEKVGAGKDHQEKLNQTLKDKYVAHGLRKF